LDFAGSEASNLTATTPVDATKSESKSLYQGSMHAPLLESTSSDNSHSSEDTTVNQVRAGVLGTC
jgi:hypothetical protein